MKVRLLALADIGWGALGLGAATLAAAYFFDFRLLWLAGCIAVAVGIVILGVARWRGETVMALGATDHTEASAYYVPPEVPYPRAEALLGDRGEERRQN